MRSKFAGLLVATISVGALQSASAADMPVKAPIYKAPPYVADLWSGIYFGGHIGGGWAITKFSDPLGGFTNAGDFPGANGSSFLGGPQVGFNWQVGTWVFGVQGDISFSGMKSSIVAPLFATTTFNTRTTSITTVTGRWGYAWDRSLFYIKGGGAWVRNDYDATDPTFGFAATGSGTQGGYVVGGGWEYAFAPSWSVFLEYDYVGVGTKSVTLNDPVFGPQPFNVKQDVQMVKTGVNFKMGTGAWMWPH
jgi:outer membrane immunogenic protein